MEPDDTDDGCTDDGCKFCHAPTEADCICHCDHKRGGAHRTMHRWYCNRCGDELEGPDPDSAWDSLVDRE